MPNAKILVVEDHLDTLHLYETYLSLEGFTVVAAANAAAALERTSHGIDAITTDWAMPGMDGLEFVRLVRARSNAVPIIVVSGQADPHKESELFEVGACRVLRKPCDLAALADLVRWLTSTCSHDCDTCPNRVIPGRDLAID